MRITPFEQLTLATVIAGVFALSGCGGGGSTTTTSTTAGSVTVSGTAATGAAIAGAAVDAKCSTGTGTATTASDGSFTLAVSGGTLPCVLHLKASDGTELHSIVESGTTTANITPVSELIVARMAGEKPQDFYDSFDATKITSSSVSDAKTAVLQALKDAGVDLGNTDPLHDSFQAAHDGKSGDALDGKLDELKTKLTQSQTSVDALAQALANNKDADANGTGAIVANMLQPAASSCAAMHSGKYRVIAPENTDPDWLTYVGDFDAQAITLTDHGVVNHGSAVANESCEFQNSDGSTKFLFAKSGIVVSHHTTSGTPDRVAFAFPEQPLTVADLVGTWDMERFSRTSSTDPYVFSHAIVTIASDGSMTTADCQQIVTSQADCAAPVESGSIAVASGGGFTFTPSAGGTAQQAFAYRSPAGTVALALLEPANNGWDIAAKQTARVLPTVGDKAKFWDMKIASTGYLGALTEQETTITAVDASIGSYSREFKNGAQTDTFVVNKPYAGLAYRTSGTANIGGTPTAVPSIISLKLPGMGVTVYGKPVADTSSFFGIRVDKP